MKQILQNLGSGETSLAEVPAPLARPGHLLIRTEASLVSLGTEKMLVVIWPSPMACGSVAGASVQRWAVGLASGL